MAYVTLRAPAGPQLMFHGTSSAHLPAILAGGLRPRPPEGRLTHLVGSAEPHLVAFEGIYLSFDPDRVGHYAREAAKAFGGDPIVVTAQVEPGDAHPDEDEMLYVLMCRFDLASEERDHAPGFAGLFRDAGFRVTFARGLAADIEEAFEPDAVDREAMARHLGTVLEAVAALPRQLSAVTGGKGWLVQPWILRMARTPEGLARYRTALDGLCRSVLGPRPTSDTCDWDGYKLRKPGGVPAEGRTFVAAIGSLDDPRLHLDRLDEVDAEPNPLADDFLGTRLPSPR